MLPFDQVTEPDPQGVECSEAKVARIFGQFVKICLYQFIKNKKVDFPRLPDSEFFQMSRLSWNIDILTRHSHLTNKDRS